MKKIALLILWSFTLLCATSLAQDQPFVRDSILTSVAAADTLLSINGNNPPLTYRFNIALSAMTLKPNEIPIQRAYGLAVGLNAYCFDTSRVFDTWKFAVPKSKKTLWIEAWTSDGKPDSLIMQSFKTWGGGTTQDSAWQKETWFQDRVSSSAIDTVLALLYVDQTNGGGYEAAGTIRTGKGVVYKLYPGFRYIRFYRPNRLASKAKIYFEIYTD